MAAITVEKQINAPRACVFKHCTDLASLPNIVSGINSIEALTDGPVDNDTRFRETRTLFGREAAEVMTFTEFDPPRGYVLLAESHGSKYRTQHVFEEVEAGTRVRMIFEATPVSLMAKCMSPVFALMKKTLMKCLDDDLNDIKQACERDESSG